MIRQTLVVASNLFRERFVLLAWKFFRQTMRQTFLVHPYPALVLAGKKIIHFKTMIIKRATAHSALKLEKSAKMYYLYFQKWQKIHFFT